MTYNLEFLKADIQEELHKLQRLEQEFIQVEEIVDKPAETVSFYDRAAIGYYLHSLYNGCENIFCSVARFFENDMGADSWHKDLLKRMKLTIPGFRPALIDDELFLLLDDFRAFRHKFRHTYSFELDWEKEQLVAKKFRRTHACLREQVSTFLRYLTELDEE